MAHFSFTSLFQIGLFLILICWTKESTGSSFSLEEEFKQLKENYIQMKEIVKNFESEVTELKSEMSEVKDKIAQQDSLLFDLLQEKNERTAAAANPSAVAINGLPSSCDDLKIIGHTLNGFYSIAGSAMIESVYCDFSKLPADPDFQKWIGYADVKSAPVHFYVQRNQGFYTLSNPIPWDVARVNEGNAMNLTSGKFTAPRPGIYFFSFTGLAEFPASSSTYHHLGVSLIFNGGRIGRGYVSEENTVAYLWSPLSLQSTLKLKSGDQVYLKIDAMSSGAYLVDSSIDHFNHFTGWMLEEQIVASL